MALDEQHPSGGLFESTLPSTSGPSPSGEPGELEDGLEGVDLRRLRGLVHQRIFGGELESVEIGRYLVLERLGSGGMGVVFSAFDRELDRKVAIKLLHDEDTDRVRHERLLAEARALARLSHPNVVQVHDVGETHGRVYVAMEFVAGQTLRDWVREHEDDTQAIVAAYVQAGRGLAAAHRAGIVHRDFKPDNVIVGEDGRIRVLDFGISRAASAPSPAASSGSTARPSSAEGSGPRPPLTQTGALLGTPAYMAPEQLRGAEVDARSDQFAFCVSLYESLQRARPFAGKTYPTLVQNVLAGSLRPFDAKVPRWLREVLARGLAVEPERRYPSMDALLAELARDRVGRRRRARVAVGVLALAGLGLVAWSQRERDLLASSEALATEVRSEAERADAAERELVAREDAVTLAEASLALVDSPIQGVARLRELSDDPSLAGAVRIIAGDAWQRGLPQAIASLPEGLELLRSSDDGGRALLVDPATQTLHGYALASGAQTELDLRTESSVLALSPGSGRHLAVLVDEGEAVVIRDLEGGASRRVSVPGEAAPKALAISADGRWLAGWPIPGAGWLIGPEGEVETLPFEDRRELAFLPGDAGVLIRDDAGRLFRRAPGGELTELAQGINQIHDVSPNGEYLATLGWGNAELLLVPLAPGREPRRFATLDDDHVLSVAWAPGGTKLALGGANGSGVVIDVDSGERVELPQHEGWLRSLVFSADGAQLASASFSGSVFVTRLADGEAEPFPGHRSMGWVHFDAEGTLHSVDLHRTIRAWDPAPRKRQFRTNVGLLREIGWSKAGPIALRSDTRVVVVDPERGETLWRNDEFFPCVGLSWSPEGETLATAYGDGTLRLWSLDGELRATVGEAGPDGSSKVTALSFVGAHGLAWADADAQLHVQALDDASASTTIDAPQLRGLALKALAYDDARDWLWAAGPGPLNLDRILAFDLRDPDEPVFDRTLAREGLTDLVVVPGRDAIAYSTWFGAVYTLAVSGDTSSVQPEPVELGSHRGAIATLDVDARGTTLYTASHDGTGRVWDLDSGRWRSVPARQGQVLGVAGSPQGHGFATADVAGYLRIWPDELPREWAALREWIARQAEVEVEPLLGRG